MKKILLWLKYHLWPVYMYKVQLDSRCVVGTKAESIQERENLLQAGYHLDEIVMSWHLTTQAELDKMPEFDGF